MLKQKHIVRDHLEDKINFKEAVEHFLNEKK